MLHHSNTDVRVRPLFTSQRQQQNLLERCFGKRSGKVGQVVVRGQQHKHLPTLKIAFPFLTLHLLLSPLPALSPQLWSFTRSPHLVPRRSPSCWLILILLCHLLLVFFSPWFRITNKLCGLREKSITTSLLLL